MKLIYMTIIFVTMIVIMCIYSVTNTAYGKSTESNCVIQKIYTPDKETLLETKMVCRDGTLGPSYWELFAEFYYSGVTEQEYCRYVRGNNIFNIPKKVCLNKDGTWMY